MGSEMCIRDSPLRDQILRLLKEHDRSTVELEALTGENRYNLYHHLDVLLKNGLVQELDSQGRARVFAITKPKKPDAAVMLLSKEDRARDPEAWGELLNKLEEVEGEPIPHKRSVKKIQV